MRYEIAPLFCRPWTLNGITPKLIDSHYENNYGAIVARLNAIVTEIETADPVTTSSRLLTRLKSEEAAALNSALLHEIYFASLGGDGRAVPEALAAALEHDFGSVDGWKREFVALTDGLHGDAGWVLLSWAPRLGRLINQSISDVGPVLAGAVPLLSLDMCEHAYHLDFGANAGAYVAAFMRNIDWTAVQARYDDAAATPAPRPMQQEQFSGLPSVSVAQVNTMLQSGTPVQIIDVRPRHYSTRAQDMMAGAVWRDPERVDEWIGDLSKDVPVVAFCVYGFHIGCETTAKLREAGFDASYMAGGHSAWKAANGTVKLFDKKALSEDE